MARKRCIVVGIDGATLSVISSMLERDELPTFRTFAQSGILSPLVSTFPPISAPAWASFMTGKNPGKHGVFDFRANKAGQAVGHDRPFTSFHSISSPTFWEIAGRQNKIVGIVGVPMTYPPTPVNGMLVCGFPAPKPDLFTWPPELSQTIREREGTFYFDLPWSDISTGQNERLVEAAKISVENRYRVFCHVAQMLTWDLLVVVFTECDRLQHFLWSNRNGINPNLENPPCSAAILDHYRHLDTILSQIVAMADPETSIVLLSDHGGGILERKIFLNRILEEIGYLKTLPQTGLMQVETPSFDFLSKPDAILSAGVTSGPEQDGATGIMAIWGDSRRVMFQHPPGVLRYHIKMPVSPVIQGACGFHPRAWHSQGGKIQFQIVVTVAHETYEVFFLEIDPRNRPNDRKWFDFQIPLPAFSSLDVSIDFRIETDGIAHHCPCGWANVILYSGENAPAPIKSASMETPRRIDWSKTIAYAGSETEMGIFLNVKGRETWGIVSPEDYASIRSKLMCDLESFFKSSDKLRWNDQVPVLNWIRRREDVYQGPFLNRAPDILCMFDDMRSIAVDDMSDRFDEISTLKTGTHRMEGLVGLLGPQIKPATSLHQAHIIDLAPTILYLLDCPISLEMDGQVLWKAFSHNSSAITETKRFEKHQTSVKTLNPEEEAAMRRQLARLGYL